MKYKKGWKTIRRNKDKMKKQYCNNALSHYEIDCTPAVIQLMWIVSITIGIAITISIIEYL
jgi:hypothetical protein